MQKLTIGFSKPTTWKPFSELIMFGYNIQYDHVYIKFHSDTYNRDLIYQASSTMVNFMSPVIFEQNNIIIKEFQFNISDTSMQNIIQFAIDNSGKPYGVKEVFGLIYVRIMDLFNKKVSNPFRDNQVTYICCELVAFIIKEFMNIDISTDIYDINPKMLFDYISNLKVSNG